MKFQDKNFIEVLANSKNVKDKNWNGIQLEFNWNKLISDKEVINKVSVIIGNDGYIKNIEGIEIFPNLKQLFFSKNKITKLPESIWNLTKLLNVNLSYNQIEELPESIGELTKLKWLYLHNNKLTTLPDSIWKLTKLKRISLDTNKIKILPDNIRKFYKNENDLSYKLRIIGLNIWDINKNKILYKKKL